MVEGSRQVGALDVLWAYDRAGDVLYVALGEPRPAEGEDRPNGIVLRYAMEDESPCGVTVIGYKRNGWQKKIARLSEIISAHLSIEPKEIASAIIEAELRIECLRLA
jgi:hypothetical protein